MRLMALCFALAVAACTGSAPAPSVDAQPARAPDAAVSGNGTAFGGTCTTVSDTSTECATHVCTDSFNQSATPLCSQKCTMIGVTDPSCPSGSMGMKCNMKGYCKP